MAWFFKKKKEEEINALQLNMNHSFDLLKYDVDGIKSSILINNQNVYQWLQFLYQKIQEQDQKIAELKNTGKTSEKPLLEHLSHLLKRRSEPKPPAKPTVFKERVVKKITKNSKQFIKNTIISLINKYQRISSTELKEMIVEEQKLTTKSTFYRILKEIEKTAEISTLKQDGDRIFISSIYAKH